MQYKGEEGIEQNRKTFDQGEICLKENKIMRVKKFYNSFVRIYDLLKIPWNKIFSQKAEKKFSEFLINNLDQETSVLELGCGTGVNLEKIYDLDVEFNN